MPSLNSALVFSLLLASATAFQGGLQHRSRLPYHSTAVFMPRAGRMASVVRRAEAEAEAEAMDLDLEEMFDIFEKADSEISNEEVGMAPDAADPREDPDNSKNDKLKAFTNGDISQTPIAYQVGLGVFVAGWAVILGGIATGNPVI